jgi:predicted esterase
MSSDPHAGLPVQRLGPPPAEARLAAILVHGRGASPDDILTLAQELSAPDVMYLAPRAAGHTWYPYSFLSPIDQNEPGISSGLRVLSSLVADLGAQRLPPERIVLMGFSQGGCLVQEFAVRHAERYAAIIGLSSGLIGPPGTPRDYPGSFAGTPVFLGCSDVDPHIPVARVHESADVFRRMHASVDERIYRRMGHTVNADELEAVDALLQSVKV